MRISLLMQREPLPTIVEQTLSAFWSRRYGQEYNVRWHNGATPISDGGAQTWWVNNYLNAIAVRHATAASFEPLRREFSRSLHWWKRPAQQLYVRLASCAFTAPLLAHAALHVSPPVPDAAHQMVVAGNHKLRLLDHRQGRAYGILKAGFCSQFLDCEIETRQKAAACGVPVPPLHTVDADGAWFAEEYISGTPANRLPDQTRASVAVRSVYNSLQPLHETTVAHTTFQAYATALFDDIQQLIAANTLLDEAQRSSLAGAAAALRQLACAEPARPLTTTLCHGDFQPANILINARGPWLIDWEYAARRQAAYDPLVYALASRSPQGLAARLQSFVRRGWPHTTPFVVDYAYLPPERRARRCHAALFLLEELHQHLRENTQPAFTRTGQGLSLLHVELKQWLEQAMDHHA